VRADRIAERHERKGASKRGALGNQPNRGGNTGRFPGHERKTKGHVRRTLRGGGGFKMTRGGKEDNENSPAI